PELYNEAKIPPLPFGVSIISFSGVNNNVLSFFTGGKCSCLKKWILSLGRSKYLFSSKKLNVSTWLISLVMMYQCTGALSSDIYFCSCLACSSNNDTPSKENVPLGPGCCRRVPCPPAMRRTANSPLK